MSLKDITITGSIGSIATQSYGQKTYVASSDDQSFPIEHISGSDAKAWPNFVQGTYYTVDLIVNVTQSWSGSNTTPLGIVPYIHNTMEEFIDGEFSGSNYIVTDGSLNDAQCEQFLTVNTTPTSYAIFPYYASLVKTNSNIYAGYLSSFLSTNTVPRDGEALVFILTNKVQYLKVARIDQEGADNTLSLQELTQFSWTDSNYGKIVLYIKNITEYPGYYLYEIVQNSFPTSFSGSLADDNFLNYAFSVSSATTMSATTGLFYLNSWNVNNNASGQWDGIYYTFALTPNCPIIYTASITATNYDSSPADFDFGFWGSSDFINYSPIQTSSLITLAGGGTSTTITLTGTSSNGFTAYTAYWLETSNLTLPISLSNASWILTQSQVPQNSTSSIVIEPYLLSNFRNSDCDVLMNNYSLNDVSEFYRAVLYDNGGTTPSNFQQIISGTAEYAQINDYLYHANASKLPRYNGVRTTSANFNLPSQNGLSNEQLAVISSSNDLVINNGSPNVEQTTTYFAYFTSLKSNIPIYLNTTSPVLKYLIREDGELFSPSTDDATYYNTVDSFETGKKAYTSLFNNITTIFNNTSSILLSGVSYRPILYSISSSTTNAASFSQTLDFKSLDGGTFVGGTPPNYTLSVRGLNTAVSPIAVGASRNLFSNTTSNTVLQDAYPGWDNTSLPTTKPYYVFNGVPGTSVNITAISNVNFPVNSTVGTTTQFTTTIWSLDSTNTISTALASVTQTITVPTWFNQNTYPFNVDKQAFVTKNNFFPQVGDKLYVTVTNNGPNPVYGGTAYNTAFDRLTISPNAVTTPKIGGGVFWTTGSTNGTSITSSVALGQFLLGNYQQEDIISSGFDPIELPCEIKVGDEIRFEYDEANTYRVIDVLPTGSGGNPIFHYKLDGIIPYSPALDMNHFTVRRKVKDYITGISLDANLIAPISGGFLMPEYPSSTIKKNLPTIINSLSARNII